MITVDPPSKAIGKAALTRFAGRARVAAGLRGAVDVLLTDDATIRGLNRSFRGKDKATDVLSFPAIENQAKHVGDLAVSLETAARQAAEQGHLLEDEVRVLMLHGMLHLAGFDHERDEGEMAAREAELRVELGLPVGLIARVEAKGRKAKADSSASLRKDNHKSKRVARGAVRG